MTLSYFWQKHSAKIIIIFLIIAGLLAAWLLYQRYLRPQYELAQLLPKNYQISFEFKKDRFTFPALQQQKILKNPVLKSIFNQIENDINYELNKLPMLSRALLEKADHLILFWQNPQKYGLILEIANEKMAKELAKADFAGWEKAMVKNQILALASNTELLNEMTSQKLLAGTPSYLSLTITSWLTVRFQNSFLTESYQSSVLTNLQQILQPLTLTATSDYQLEIDSDPYSLSMALIPAQSEVKNDEIDLQPFLNYILSDPDLTIGINNLEYLTKQVENNQNLQKLWQKFDAHLWISKQLSLSSLAKQLKPPVLFSQKNDQWQILTTIENKNLLEYYLKSYFAQLEPREIAKTLPDGTLGIELLANPNLINWTEGQINGFLTFSYAKNQSRLGFAIKDNLLLVSNNIKELNLEKPDLSCSLTNQKTANMAINTVISLKPTVSWLNPAPLCEGKWCGIKLGDNLKNFSKISAISSPDGQIRVCLGL